MATKQRSSLLPCKYAAAIALAAIVSCSVVVVDCGSEVKDDAAAARPDGGREGPSPPAPRPGTVHRACPDPEPECSRRHGGAPPPPPTAPVAPHRKIGRGW